MVKKMFRLMDENSSGSVNEAEAIPMLKMVLGSPEAAVGYWKDMLDKCDKDKNSKIDEKGAPALNSSRGLRGTPRFCDSSSASRATRVHRLLPEPCVQGKIPSGDAAASRDRARALPGGDEQGLPAEVCTSPPSFSFPLCLAIAPQLLRLRMRLSRLRAEISGDGAKT